MRYFIDHAPQGSHLWAANAADKDIAETLLKVNNYKIPASKHVPLEGYDDLKAILLDIADLLAMQLAGADKFKPAPRPKTALDEIKREIKETKKSALAAQLTGFEG